VDRSLEVRSKRRETSEMECDQPSTSSGITHGFPEEHILLEITDNQVRPWTVTREKENDDIKLELKDDVHSIPKYTVVLNSAMEFTVHVFHWPIPENHSVYTERKRRLNSVEDCQRLLHLIESSNICEGLPQDERTIENAEDPTSQVDWSGFPVSTVVRHSVPKALSESNFQSSVAFRSPNCEVILPDVDETMANNTCPPCTKALSVLEKRARRKQKTTGAPAKSKAPLTSCSSEKLVATVKSTRLQCKQLEDRIAVLEERIKEDGVGVSGALENDILKIMGGQNLEATPHMKFFWEQQMKLLKSAKMGRRYHPQIIRFALSLHGKSPAAYRELRDSGALVLPSERVLRDYKNYFKPKAGINPENIEALREKAASLTGTRRYTVIVMDEMKIQSNLVFDKHSGDLIGFVDLGDPMTNYASLGDEDLMATHALAFLVRGMCSDLKHVIAYYFTENVTSYQLISVFWKVVAVLELSLNLLVIAAVNDGASPNRKFFNLHAKCASGLNCDVIYKVPNIFATSRFIFFFADACHLIKTARNCLYNSGSGSRSRLMWNNGQYLLFRHVADLFYSDQEFALHTLPKLSLDHIVLTSYSKMKVKLAVQVLSSSVAIALEESGKEEVAGTAQFCRMMNGFFDCTNVRSLTEHVKKRNHFIKPYNSKDDDRFTWLINVFLKYLEDWRKSIDQREGNFSPDDKAKMFLSVQTYNGLKISVHSHIEAIQFLLDEGFQYVLSERFMQDVLEDYFGHQRSKGGHSDNPTAQQFGYNDLTIAAQRDIAPVLRGNVGGRYEKIKWHQVSEQPVQKRKKPKK
jgi:hypothetical protein